jgi:hypothetical protein
MNEPAWTERTDKRGLDPLGIQNAGVNLYQDLLPGISNVTLRVRYYGFYCWVSDTYGANDGSTEYRAWKLWVRRAEATFALVAAHVRGQGGVGGIDWADRRLAQGEELINFAQAASDDTSVQRYLAQDLGVFGGAYYTQMVELGLFVEGEFGIQRAHNVAGRALAEAFRQSIGVEVEALLLKTIQTAVVTRSVLDGLAPIVPSAIPDGSVERSSYEEVLFGMTQSTDAALSRAASLRLILSAADAVEERPTVEDIRWHLFFAHYSDGSNLEAQRLRWEAYQCQDIFQVAAAALLEWSTTLMDDTAGGSSLAEISATVISELSAQSVDAASSWSALRDRTRQSDFDYRAAWGTLVSRRGSVAEKAWSAVTVMSALHHRLVVRSDLFAAVRKGLSVVGNARSIMTEITWLAARENEPVSEVIAGYMTERVIRRHSWVAMQKLRRQRDYTFLFELRDGRFVRRKGYAPAPTTPRLGPSVQFLEDIGLIDAGGLTASGKTLLGVVA